MKHKYIILANFDNGDYKYDKNRLTFSSIKSAEKIARQEFSSGWTIRIYDIESHNMVKVFKIR